jgi:hypothetical protein
MKYSKKADCTAQSKVRKAGSKDMSHAARVLNAGWRKGSACFYVQARLNQPTETIAKAIMKTEFKNQSCFSTLAKAKSRINTLKAQAKALHIRKAR